MASVICLPFCQRNWLALKCRKGGALSVLTHQPLQLLLLNSTAVQVTRGNDLHGANLISHFGMAGTHGLAHARVLQPKLLRGSALGFRGNHSGNHDFGNHAFPALRGLLTVAVLTWQHHQRGVLYTLVCALTSTLTIAALTLQGLASSRCIPCVPRCVPPHCRPSQRRTCH